MSSSIGTSTAPPAAPVASPLPRVAYPHGGDTPEVPGARATPSNARTGAPETTAASASDVKKAIERITDFVKYTASDVQFSVDQETDALVVKVIDRNSKEVLRQIPSEEVLQIAKTLDSLQGLFVRQKV